MSRRGRLVRRLRLALEPIVPLRSPVGTQRSLEYGYRLRLPRGPLLTAEDPLLAAHGAAVARLWSPEQHREALQDPRFEPGSALCLFHDTGDQDDPHCVRVLDAAGILEAGELTGGADELAAAGLDNGLGTRAIALSESRLVAEQRRVGLEVLVFAPGLVSVGREPRSRFMRPERPGRTRVVLYADGTPDVRWWDPAGAGGPADLLDLPVSEELAAELSALRDGYARLAAPNDDDEMCFETWEREALDERARALWRRARFELGRRYVVGFLGPDMRRPVWSPGELDENPVDALLEDVEFE